MAFIPKAISIFYDDAVDCLKENHSTFPSPRDYKQKYKFFEFYVPNSFFKFVDWCEENNRPYVVYEYCLIREEWIEDKRCYNG